MIAVVIFAGAFVGFLAGALLIAALTSGKNEDRCRSCQREAILRAYRIADGEDEWRDGTE